MQSGLPIIIKNNLIRFNDGNQGSGWKVGGIYIINADSVIVDSNMIYGNYGYHGGAVTSRISILILRYNVIFENNAYFATGVFLRSPQQNSIIQNNTIAYNQATAYAGGLHIDQNSNEIMIKNNIIANNGSYGVWYDESSGNVQLIYNCIFGNASGQVFGIIPGIGNIYVDPQFLSPENHDFSLMGSSPCINAGDPSSPYDPDSTIADMGALYFNQGYRILDFHLIAPQSDSVYLETPDQFIWHSTTDIDSGYTVYYTFYIDDNMLFDSPDSSGELSDTVYTLPDTLDRSIQYYWRVLAYNYHAVPIYSDEIWNLYIDGYPTMPIIIAPDDGAVADSSTYLAWIIGTDPDPMDTVTYTLQVDDDPMFNSPEIDISGITESGLLLEEAVAVMLGELPGFNNLQQNQAYYWRVRSDDIFRLNSGFTDGSNYFSYGININDPPNPPGSGFSPSDGEEISADTPTISWNHATDPDPEDNASNLSYRLQLDSDGEFDTSFAYEYLTSQGINQVEVVTALTDTTQWFYRVQTIDDEGAISVWSEIQNFWVRLYNLSPYPPDGGFDPANDIEIDEALPTVSWNHATDPDVEDDSTTLHYILQLDNDAEFDTTIAFEYTTPEGVNYQTLTDSLAEDNYWSYRIRTVDDGGLMSIWSQIQNFWVNYDNQPPDPPEGEFYPSNGQIVDTAYPELMWNYSTDPDPSDSSANISYHIQVDNDGEFDTTVAFSYATPPGINTLTVTDSLADDMQWYYRIQAEDDGGLTSEWTPIQYFWVNQFNSPPNSPIDGFSPANSEEVISLIPVITWNHATDPDPDDDAANLSYAIRLSQDSTFSGFVYNDTTVPGINQIQPADSLEDNSHYFYGIMTIDDEGLASEWSATQNFWTNHYNYPPEPFPLYAPPDSSRRVDYYTYFTWGNTVDYDPLSSYDFTLQYSPDSTFSGFVMSIAGLTDTSLTIPTDTLALAGQNLFWRVLAIDDDSLITIGGIPEPEARRLTIVPPGDANGNGEVTGSDVTYLVAYFKGNNPPPDPLLAGDPNGDCNVLGSDVTYLVRYFKGIGAAPVRGDCEQQPVLSKKGGVNGK